MIHHVQCEICFETVATCDLEKLRLPLTGDQFGSPDEFHGIPPPFHPSLPWEDLRCPHCQFRPFTERDSVVIFTFDGLERVTLIPNIQEIVSEIQLTEVPQTGEEVVTPPSFLPVPPPEAEGVATVATIPLAIPLEVRKSRNPVRRKQLFKCHGCRRFFATKSKAKACTHGVKGVAA